MIMLEDDYTTKYEGFDPSDPESYIFMNLMQNSFLEQSFKFARCVDEAMKGGAFKASRGISQDPFYVLWRTAMPAVLVECGFMSNPSDREALISSAGKERIASDLYKAFVKYKKDYDGASAVAPVTPTTPEKAPEAEPKTEEPKPQVVEQPDELRAYGLLGEMGHRGLLPCVRRIARRDAPASRDASPAPRSRRARR